MILLYGMLEAVSALLDFTIYPVVASVVMICAWIVTVGMLIWIFVGLWRSAKVHTDTFWRTATKTFALIGSVFTIFVTSAIALPQSIQFFKIATDSDDTLTPYSLRLEQNETELILQGAIRYGITEEIKSIFTSHPNIKLITLQSPGGMIGEADKLASFLSSKDVVTYVQTFCESACTDVFLAGSRRIIHEDASLGFHAPYVVGMPSFIFASAVEDQKETMRKRGIEESFVDKAFGLTGDALWHPNIPILLEAHVVHEVVREEL